jgi:ADP-ribose pyrophosphatase YjhB (NUDIX family)
MSSCPPDSANWLRWARRLQGIAQDGLTYTKDRYDAERYEELRGIVADILAAHSSANPDFLRGLLVAETGPATPKVDVRAATFQDDKILLVKEKEDGLWAPPGGWADVGESPAEAVVRETREESGHLVRAVRLIAVYDRDRHGHPPIPYHVYKLVFLCEILDRDPAVSVDADGIGFFDEAALPNLSLSRVTPEQISAFFEHHRRTELPMDFD